MVTVFAKKTLPSVADIDQGLENSHYQVRLLLGAVLGTTTGNSGRLRSMT